MQEISLGASPPGSPVRRHGLPSPSSSRYTTALETRLKRFAREIAGQNSKYFDRSGTTYQMVTLGVAMAIITLFGMVVHIAHPTAAQDRDRRFSNPPSPAQPPPPDAPLDATSPPPLFPSPAEPPTAPPLQPIVWWQRARSRAETVQAAWIELLLCVVLCFLAPGSYVYFRRKKVRRRRLQAVITRMTAGKVLRHTKLVDDLEKAPAISAKNKWQRGCSKSILAATKELQLAREEASAAERACGAASGG